MAGTTQLPGFAADKAPLEPVTVATMAGVLSRLVYLGVTNTLAPLRLLPMSDRDKDAGIAALRHRTLVLERQLHGDRVRFTPGRPGVLAPAAARTAVN